MNRLGSQSGTTARHRVVRRSHRRGAGGPTSRPSRPSPARRGVGAVRLRRHRRRHQLPAERDDPSGGSLELNTGTFHAGDGDAYSLAGNVGLPLGETGFANLRALPRTRGMAAIGPARRACPYGSRPSLNSASPGTSPSSPDLSRAVLDDIDDRGGRPPVPAGAPPDGRCR